MKPAVFALTFSGVINLDFMKILSDDNSGGQVVAQMLNRGERGNDFEKAGRLMASFDADWQKKAVIPRFSDGLCSYSSRFGVLAFTPRRSSPTIIIPENGWCGFIIFT